MSAKNIVMAAAGATTEKAYVDDVFSTYLYTGNGSTQTIDNGINLLGNGGMVWVKNRGASTNHILQSNTTSLLRSNLADAAVGTGGVFVTNFNVNGFSVSSGINDSSASYVSWTFRKAPKFFDVVTYEGGGAGGQQIAHSLGSVPGCIIVKCISASSRNWMVWHRSAASLLYLNTTGAVNGYTSINNVTSSSFTVNGGTSLDSTSEFGLQYVAYLFAHETTADSWIQCGSYTGNGSLTGPEVTLGWEPQWLMIKRTNNTGNWNIFDNARGLTVSDNDARLSANTADIESSTNLLLPTSNGFQIVSTSTDLNSNASTYIYVAIRQPNKPPTSGTQVFTMNATAAGDPASTGSSAARAGIRNIDMVMLGFRGGADARNAIVADKLRGFKPSTNKTTPYLVTSSTNSETTSSSNLYVRSFPGLENHLFYDGVAGQPLSAYAFRRAPGFFDVVCYTGDAASNRAIAHNLGVKPELIITKNLSGGSPTVTNWVVSALVADLNYGGTTFGYVASLNTTGGFFSNDAYFTNTAPTSTQFSVTLHRNYSGTKFVAYLFASAPGVSKVGTYTGNGSSQVINCGFAAGARFVLVKRRDSTGDWYVWDSLRGIISGNDPYLRLNSTAAEVTSNDSIDPDSTGFVVNQVAATNINVSSATYLYLAIA